MPLQAFAGHLLVVGGRAVSMPPPGALAETAPKRAPRIREGDTFFILLTPVGQATAPAAFFESLARLAADTYFSSSGGITGGLREAITTVNGHLIASNQQSGEAKRVSALALVLHGDELYTARSGQVFGALGQAGALLTFPADRRDSLSMNLTPLGTGPDPEIQLGRYAVAAGQMMLLADTGLLEADDTALLAALQGDSVRAALDQIKGLARGSASATVIQFVEPGTPDLDHLAPQSSTQKFRVELPAPRSSKVPVVPAETPTTAPPLPARSSSQTGRTTTGQLRPPPDEDTTGRRAKAAMERVSDMASTVADRSSPAVQNFPALLMYGIRRVLRALLSGLLAVLNFLQRALNQVLPAPDAEGRQGIPTNIAVIMAILIPVVIVIVVLGLSMSKQGRTQFEIERDTAVDAYNKATELDEQAGPTCEIPTLRANWVEVLRLANKAAERRPNDETLNKIRLDAQNYLDCYDGVERRTITLLHEFPDGAELIGPIVNNGIYLYTLDRAHSAIYYDILNERRDGLSTRNDDPIIYKGQAVFTYIIGDIFDIEWMEDGATANKNVLIALDQNGVLAEYSQTFFSTAQQLVTTEWQHPVAMAVFGANLYILDPPANQVWRYKAAPGENRYVDAPESYFATEQLPDLTGAVDIGISDKGELYILFADAHIKKFLSGVEQSFEYSSVPGGALTSGTALFVDNDPMSSSLFVVDKVSQTVYHTSWAGKFRGGLRPQNDPDAFRNLSGVYADQVTSNAIYVAAGNKLYYFRRN